MTSTGRLLRDPGPSTHMSTLPNFCPDDETYGMGEARGDGSAGGERERTERHPH